MTKNEAMNICLLYTCLLDLKSTSDNIRDIAKKNILSLTDNETLKKFKQQFKQEEKLAKKEYENCLEIIYS